MTEKPPFDPSDTSHPLYDSSEDPTHPFYAGNKTESEPKPDPSDKDAYKIGPGFPPNEHKWKKGCPSPYPKGRPRKIPSMRPDLKKAFEAALNEKVVITKDKKRTVLTKATLGIKQLVNQFANGDRHARRDVFQYAALLGVDLHAKDLIAEQLGVNDQAIVDAFLRRQQPSAGAAPDDHVKAPTDLLDDDVAKPKPTEMPAASPQSNMPASKPLEPELDEHGRPKPRDRAFIQAERERNLAQQKKNQDQS